MKIKNKIKNPVTRLSLILCALFLVLIAGCATKPPPLLDEIHQQSGTLTNFALTNAWKAGAATGPIADNWLATFNDVQLNALVAEAMTNNPDLRASAPRVEQAAQYVRLAQAAMRPVVNLVGTGGLKMGGGDVGSALQGVSLGTSWEPDLWGRLRYGRNAYESTYASAQADFEFGRQSLAATMAKSWFTATETWLQLQRYMQHFPAAGEVVIFDRSWYNRAGVEYVMGFCTKDQHARFLELCPEMERYIVDGGIQLIKIWLESSDKEQKRRFEARMDDPLRQWKLSPMDLPSRSKWFEYSRARDLMLKATDTKWAPWHILRSDDKKRARLNCLAHILNLIPYKKVPSEKVKLPKRSMKGAYDDQASLKGRKFVPEKY